MASTSVVLPWSTWATIATLRMSVRAGMRKRSIRHLGLLTSYGLDENHTFPATRLNDGILRRA